MEGLSSEVGLPARETADHPAINAMRDRVHSNHCNRVAFGTSDANSVGSGHSTTMEQLPASTSDERDAELRQINTC